MQDGCKKIVVGYMIHDPRFMTKRREWILDFPQEVPQGSALIKDAIIALTAPS